MGLGARRHVNGRAFLRRPSFRRKQRHKKTLHCELLDIDGVGSKTAQKLIKAFGSVKRVRTASAEALSEVVGPKAAERIRGYFEGQAT